jgi:hypothetical protein
MTTEQLMMWRQVTEPKSKAFDMVSIAFQETYRREMDYYKEQVRKVREEEEDEWS